MKYFYSLFLVITLGLNAQVTPQWTARFNGAGDFNDKVNCMVQDASGNRYLGGYTLRSGNEKDFIVFKIDLNGDTVWTRTFDGSNHGNDEALDIAFDPTGYIFATGYVAGNNTNNDLFLVKLNLAGDTSWTRTYNNITNQDEQGNAVAVDASGNVVVTGYTDLDAAPLTTNYDYLTIKYSAAGIQTWIKTYNGLNNTNDYANDVIVQANGNCVVTGKGKNNDDDFVTRSYDGVTGAIVWTATMDGGQGDDKAVKMVQDNGGNIIVTGQAYNGNDMDYGVVKYSSAGSEIWRNFYDNGAGDDFPHAIAVDATGNIFITGKCDTDMLLPIIYDLVTVGYNSAGVEQWATPFNGSGNGNDEGYDIATDANGNVFVTGKTDRDVSTILSDYDMITIKYNSTGTQQWQKIIGTTLGDDGGVVILTDATGNCVAAGNIINTGTMKDIRYEKYSSNGTLVWSKDYLGLGDHSDVVNGMTADASGNSYMCGFTYSANNRKDWCVIKVNSIGDTAWVRTINGTSNSDDEAVSIAVDATGNVYATGFIKDTTNGNNYCTVKYNSAGALQWMTKYNNALANGGDKATAMVINAAGEIFVTGESDVDPSNSNNKDIVTIKYSNAGAQMWIMTFAGSGGLNDKPYAMDLSPNGDIVVVGKVAVSAIDDDAVVLKYTSTGTLSWSFIYMNSLGNDAALAVDQDINGNVGVAMRKTNAALNDDICFGHLDASGNDLGIISYNGTANGNDKPSSIAFDNSGNVFITGQTDVDPTLLVANYDVITIKYSSTGSQLWTSTYAGTAGDDDNGAAVVVDNATGYAYVAAQTQNGTMAIKNNDISILQYDPAGNSQLFALYDGATRSDGPSGMMLVGGNLYVSGSSTGTNNNQKDMIMLLYSGFQVGIPTAENLKSTSVYPNPCSEFTGFHFNTTSTNRSISILDVNGKVILNSVANDEMAIIKLDQFAPGVYFAMISEEGKSVENIKIVIQ